MEYIHNTEQFQFHNTVVALGKFDGMHKGHQLIFDELIQYKQLGYQAAVFSFDRPPLNMLKHKHMRVIYTTNAIESVNMSLRKLTKNRGSFPSDEALLKLFYLALRNISQKWTMPIRDWKAALNRFTIEFGDRIAQL